MRIDPHSVNPDEIQKDYESLVEKKVIIEKDYKSAEKEANELQQNLNSIEKYLWGSLPHSEREQANAINSIT